MRASTDMVTGPAVVMSWSSGSGIVQSGTSDDDTDDEAPVPDEADRDDAEDKEGDDTDDVRCRDDELMRPPVGNPVNALTLPPWLRARETSGRWLQAGQ
jgi:hypothetical protein